MFGSARADFLREGERRLVFSFEGRAAVLAESPLGYAHVTQFSFDEEAGERLSLSLASDAPAPWSAFAAAAVTGDPEVAETFGATSGKERNLQSGDKARLAELLADAPLVLAADDSPGNGYVVLGHLDGGRLASLTVLHRNYDHAARLARMDREFWREFKSESPVSAEVLESAHEILLILGSLAEATIENRHLPSDLARMRDGILHDRPVSSDDWKSPLLQFTGIFAVAATDRTLQPIKDAGSAMWHASGGRVISGAREKNPSEIVAGLFQVGLDLLLTRTAVRGVSASSSGTALFRPALSADGNLALSAVFLPKLSFAWEGSAVGAGVFEASTIGNVFAMTAEEPGPRAASGSGGGGFRFDDEAIDPGQIVIEPYVVPYLNGKEVRLLGVVIHTTENANIFLPLKFARQLKKEILATMETLPKRRPRIKRPRSRFVSYNHPTYGPNYPAIGDGVDPVLYIPEADGVVLRLRAFSGRIRVNHGLFVEDLPPFLEKLDGAIKEGVSRRKAANAAFQEELWRQLFR